MIARLKLAWEEMLCWLGNEKAIARSVEARAAAELEVRKAKIEDEGKAELLEIEAAFSRSRKP